MQEHVGTDGPMNRFEGRAIYIVRLAKVVAVTGGLDAFVERCHESRFKSIWIRLGYGTRLDPNLRTADFGNLQSKLRTANVDIWGWHLPRCPNAELATAEAAQVTEWANRYDLAGVLLDAESGDHYFLGGEGEADIYGRCVHEGLSAAGRGLALSSHDIPRNFPEFPFQVFLRHIEDNCPQVYYTKDVEERLGKSIRQYRILDPGSDFQARYKPVGNITVRGDVALRNPAECIQKASEFISLVARNDFKGYAFWCWDEAPDEIWPFLRDTEVLPAYAVEKSARITSLSEPEFVALIEDLQILNSLPEGGRSEFYDSAIAPQIEEFGLRVRDACYDADYNAKSVIGWLQLQASTLDLAVEGIGEITFDLWRRNPDVLTRAAGSLSPAERSRIEWLLREFAGDDNLSIDKLMSFDTSRFIELEALTTADLRATFVGERTFRSTRGFPFVQGPLSFSDENGTKLGTFVVNSGGGACNHKARNGPTPPGIYRISNHRPNRTRSGMVLNGVGFSFDLSPTDGTEVYHRDQFRIHPDGGNPGTNGCLGIRESADRLREAETIILNLMRANGGSFKVSIHHNT